MKIFLLFVKWPDSDDENPYLKDSWDEYSIEENPAGYEEAISNAKKAGHLRIASIEVPFDAVKKLFAPVDLGKPPLTPCSDS
jgi:hypothetical protein